MSTRTVVGLQDLELRCIVGANPDERMREQTVHISFEAEYVTDPRADSLDAAVDYSEAADRLRAVATEGRFVLLETLARACAEELSRDERVCRLWVECRKPAAREDIAYSYARFEWSRPT
jgi:FolB domain-containing protein